MTALGEIALIIKKTEETNRLSFNLYKILTSEEEKRKKIKMSFRKYATGETFDLLVAFLCDFIFDEEQVTKCSVPQPGF